MTTAPYPWSDAPPVPGRRRERWFADPDGVPSRVLAVVVAIAAPTIYMRTVLGSGRALGVAAVLVLAAVAVDLVPREPWFWRTATYLAGGIAGDLAGLGEVYALWAVACLVLADWAIRRHPPLPRLPTAEEALPGAVVLTALACWLTTRDPQGHRHLVVTAIALGVAAIAGVAGPRLGRLTVAVGRIASRVVATVSFGALGLLVVVLPWIAHRLFVLDPVAARCRPGWNARNRNDTRPSHLWTVDAVPYRMSRWRRFRWATAVPLVVLTLAGTTYLLTQTRVFGTRVVVSRPAAMQGYEWWDEYEDNLDWATARAGGASNPAEFPPLHDIVSRYINVVDGRRVSWRAPECDCRRLTVWMYGGSTVFGWGQRDEHTIASEIARAAWDQGIELDVSNRGLAGDLNWQESRRLVWDLAAEPAPDLIVVYDGSNDRRAAVDFNADRARGYSARWPVTWTGVGFDESLDRNEFFNKWFGRAPDGASRLPTVVPPFLEPDELGREVVKAYERGRLPAVATAAAGNIPVEWFWQPDRYTRPRVESEPDAQPEFDALMRAEHEAAQADLPADVHDITDVLDGFDEPLYFDDVHTNERGAQIVADRIFDVIEPRLRALDAAG